jgi:hypothetical protein
MKKRNRAPRKTSELSGIRRTSRATRGAASQKAGANKAQKSAGANRSEGIRLFQLAGRPTKEQFTRVYGEGGPKMTWAQRAAAGIPAEKFRAALTSAMRK